MIPLIAPSLLAADFARLAEDIRRVEAGGADWLHLDVMDGHFVPNITFGPPLVASVRALTRLFLDVHLMVERPENFLAPFAEAGADLLTCHVEACTDPRRLLGRIRALGRRAGLSLKPGTPAEAVVPFLDALDLVLVMTVEPGFGGQAFRTDQLEKIRTLRQAVSALPSPPRIQVDGGITDQTGPLAVAAGADVLVAGTAVFRAADPAAAIRALKAGRAG